MDEGCDFCGGVNDRRYGCHQFAAGPLDGHSLRFFHRYDAAPVLTVNSENLNFVERDADFELLVGRLRAMKSRREFFNLG